MSITVFVEGKADKRFLEDLIKINIDENFDHNKIKSLDGKDKLHLAVNSFLSNTKQGNRNIVVFDADSDYLTSLDGLKNKAAELGIKIDGLFLLPNNKDSGALEELLINLINPEHNDFLDCFNNYETCLKGNHKFVSPAIKTKVYAYVDSLNKKRKLKIANEDQRDYSDKYFWNLGAPELYPLINFLKEHLS